ncbi:sodium:proton antiporter [Rhodopseudomonas palustris]|uniref:Sodium:proton antiporter n=1 Tax=Rhodopseudomonas palustris TaxID=1076 RepID=A0A323UDJ1_RHOPL|nr:sodium:proton antiporter [Rhodopseudomonas palustris]PZA10369.1 sodium:proton antiporter [Rhodopseudomonas palustris]
MLSLFEIVAVLLALTATFAWLNHVLFGLPNQIGLLIMALAASLVLVGFELLFPNAPIFHEISDLLRRIDFSETLLNGMLGFLLFAGALQIDLSRLRARKWIVATMATIGVFISTILIAGGFWYAAGLFGVPMPFAWALVFGALISPTDPIAVLSTLKAISIPETLEMDISGESLFNDGVGVVLFTLLLTAATTSSGEFELQHFGEMFAVEAGGGALLGLVTGYVAYRAMRAIDDYPIEVLISIALATGTYALALRLHVSGPIAVVVSGVLIGNRGAALAMSDQTKRYLFGFWTLIDEILNSVLFLLIGIEVLVLGFDWSLAPLALVAIPIVMVARLISVAAPIGLLSLRYPFERGTIAILTWGGVRGGISVALVLAISANEYRPALAAATYTVALFTIVVQGLSLGWVTRRLGVGRSKPAPE